MCRICLYISAKKDNLKEILDCFEEHHRDLLSQQKNILNPLVELLSHIYPRKETISYSKLPLELIVIIKNYLLSDLKEVNREILINKSYINNRKSILKTLEEFYPESLCQQL